MQKTINFFIFFLKTKSHKLKASAGFTLIELLVAVAVLGIVSSFVFASVGKKQQDATRATQKLALDIRTAQNNSLAPTNLPVCIYGVKIKSPISYVIYKEDDCAAGKAYEDPDSFPPTPSEDIETVTLESGVTISNFSGQDIAFEAPEPITYLNGVTGTGVQPLTISLQGQSGTKNIVINRFGRIDIQ